MTIGASARSRADFTRSRAELAIIGQGAQERGRREEAHMGQAGRRVGRPVVELAGELDGVLEGRAAALPQAGVMA